MISVEPNFDMRSIHNYMEKKVKEQMDAVVAYLNQKGIEYTNIARRKTLAKEPYNNITFNLVSSVGFAIARDGVIVQSYFPLSGTGAQGKAKGEVLAERVAREYSGPSDIVLVLVAGEDYATFVQAKGKDVVSASSNAFELFLNQVWGAFK